MTLSPAAWRTLYNVLDALRPPPDEPGIEDPSRTLEAALDPEQARALRWTLLWLELETRLLRAPVRGFAWLSRAERCAVLSDWERSSVPWRRRGFARLEAAARSSRVADAQSRPGS